MIKEILETTRSIQKQLVNVSPISQMLRPRLKQFNVLGEVKSDVNNEAEKQRSNFEILKEELFLRNLDNKEQEDKDSVKSK